MLGYSSFETDLDEVFQCPFNVMNQKLSVGLYVVNLLVHNTIQELDQGHICGQMQEVSTGKGQLT